MRFFFSWHGWLIKRWVKKPPQTYIERYKDLQLRYICLSLYISPSARCLLEFSTKWVTRIIKKKKKKTNFFLEDVPQQGYNVSISFFYHIASLSQVRQLIDYADTYADHLETEIGENGRNKKIRNESTRLNETEK